MLGMVEMHKISAERTKNMLVWHYTTTKFVVLTMQTIIMYTFKLAMFYSETQNQLP